MGKVTKEIEKALKKDIEGFLGESFLLYRKNYKYLDERNALNFITQFLDLIFEYYIDLIKNFGINTLEIDYFLDYFFKKFKNNNEFEFWKMYFDERMYDIPYEKDKLLSLINKHPENLIPYFPFEALTVKNNNLTVEQEKEISLKLKQLLEWLTSQPKTTRVRFVLAYVS